MNIKDIVGRQILDSRGHPTLEVEIILQNGLSEIASVPSGASVGSKEVVEKRDVNKNYNGLGVLSCIVIINDVIKHNLIGINVCDQKKIDKILLDLDNTFDKHFLGGNTIMAISLCCFKLAAKVNNKELYEYIGDGTNLPIMFMNIINGGKHTNNKLAFQEFMIVTYNKDFDERLHMGVEVYQKLKNIIETRGYSTAVGDEGGFVSGIFTIREALNLIILAIKEAGYIPGRDVFIALDIAANNIYDSNSMYYIIEDKKYTSIELIEYYQNLIKKYPIVSIEDPFHENDWSAYTQFTNLLGDKIQIVGDDLFVTNKNLLMRGIKLNACNALIIKPNQIGTITEMLETIDLAKKYNYRMIISHRSGETEETYICDFCVGLNLKEIKIGAPSRGERICKYNRLIRINESVKKC